jgi:GntR family transcriptional regulator / MocR family aminotransferase
VSTSNSELLNQTNSGEPGDLFLARSPDAGAGKALRLTQQLRAAIVSGRLAEGERLPPTRVLAADLGISRSVVVQAYADLAADGYLEARQGAGTRVRGRPATPDPGEAAAPPTLLQTPAPVRLLGGLPDPRLFPRARWLRHYRAALGAIPDGELGYPDHRGAPELRRVLSAHLGRVRGVLANADRVLVCAGVTQGVALIGRALHRTGVRRVAVEDPCFAPHRAALALTGLTPVPVPVDACGLDVGRLAEHDVAAVLLAPAHSFPAGATLDRDRRRALLAWARQTDALVIEDDYDAELRYDRTPIGALQGQAPQHVAYLSSASKTFSPALRLGWIAAPARLSAALEHEKRHDDMGSSLIEQLAFARFVHSGDLARHLRRTRPIYRRRRDAVIDALARQVPEATAAGAAAGLHLHLALPHDADMGALVAAAHRRGVLLEDAAMHCANPADAAPGLVLGYGTLDEATVQPTVATLADALAAARS